MKFLVPGLLASALCLSAAQELTRLYPLRVVPAPKTDLESPLRQPFSPLDSGPLAPAQLQALQMTHDIQASVRELLQGAGIPFDLLERSRFYYNDRTAVLHVSAEAHDLETIDRVMRSFVQPAQVRFEVRYVEGPADLLSQFNITRPPVSPWHSHKVAEMQANAAQQPGETPPRPSVRVLTASEFGEIVRTLEKREGVDIASAPVISTLSGRQARIAIEESTTVTIPPFHAPTPRQKEMLRFNAE